MVPSCPRCGLMLEPVDASSALVCRSCGGAWLRKNGAEGSIEERLNGLPRPASGPHSSTFTPPTLYCPDCRVTVMEPPPVESLRPWVRTCARCAGIWTDAGLATAAWGEAAAAPSPHETVVPLPPETVPESHPREEPLREEIHQSEAPQLEDCALGAREDAEKPPVYPEVEPTSLYGAPGASAGVTGARLQVTDARPLPSALSPVLSSLSLADGSRAAPVRRCPQCRKGYGAADTFCPDCQIGLAEAGFPVPCLQCGTVNPIGLQQCPACRLNPHERRATPSPRPYDVLAANAGYAQGFQLGSLPLRPALKMAVVTCMDARLEVHNMLGIQHGDAHVIRNAGGIVTDDAVRSLVISHHLLGTDQILVINHTDCGMLTFGEDQFRARLIRETGRAAVSPAHFNAFSNLQENVREQLLRLRSHPWIPETVSARGFIYDVRTGRLSEVRA